MVGRFLKLFYFILKLRGTAFIIDLGYADLVLLLCLFFRIIVGWPVDLRAGDCLKFWFFVLENIALVSALEIYEIDDCPILLLLPGLFPSSALTNLLDFNAGQAHQFRLSSRYLRVG